METIPKYDDAQPPFLPRTILAGPIFPFFISAPLSPAEITIERLAFTAEVAAARPAWQIALAAALCALGAAE